MNASPFDPQEAARRFNEDENVWQRFQERRIARLLRRGRGSREMEEIQDKLDWLAAQHEAPVTRAIGCPVSSSLDED